MQNVVVIIPTYNDGQRLSICLKALAAQSYHMDNVEVMVVDNNSTEDIDVIVSAFPFCTYLREPSPGSYHARNRALWEIKERTCLIGFTDSDCIPAPDWIENAVTCLSDCPNQAIGGEVGIFFRNNTAPNVVELYESLAGFPQKAYVEKEHFAVTANLFTSSEVVAQVGMFDTSLFSGGDLEWGQRLKKHGIPLQYQNTVLVKHPARYKLTQLKTKIRRTVGGAFRQRNKTPACAALFSASSLMRGLIPPVKAIPLIRSLDNEVNILKKVQIFGLFTFLKYYQTAYKLLYKFGFVSQDERL